LPGAGAEQFHDARPDNGQAHVRKVELPRVQFRFAQDAVAAAVGVIDTAFVAQTELVPEVGYERLATAGAGAFGRAAVGFK
jgi:hypothetical protein